MGEIHKHYNDIMIWILLQGFHKCEDYLDSLYQNHMSCFFYHSQCPDFYTILSVLNGDVPIDQKPRTYKRQPIIMTDQFVRAIHS